MTRSIWRIVTALVVSSSGFIGTVVWFQSGKKAARNSDTEPIARLNQATNEVQRKPIKRVIWEGVTKNDELYPGEAVRTAPNAEAQLFFMQSGATVHLDPDSLVVLEQNGKGQSLDFLQGNLFVQSAEGGATKEGLTLKTGTTEIQLKSADLSLSKAENGDVSVDIQRGEAELSQDNKKTQLNTEKSVELSAHGNNVVERIHILSPQAGETLLLNLAKNEKLALSWKPLSAGYTIQVRMGRTRTDLNAMATEFGDQGHLSLRAKAGRWYLQLQARAGESNLPPMASAVIPIVVEPEAPPLLFEPRAEVTVLQTDPSGPQNFRWVSRNSFLSQALEVATDAQFRKLALRENLNGSATSFRAKLSEGTYYWRVTGFLKNKDKTEPLTSSTSKFALLAKWEIKPPFLLNPANDQRLARSEVKQNGVNLKWQAPAAVSSFKVSIERQQAGAWTSLLEQESDSSSLHLNELEPGTYRWRVASLDPNGGEPQRSGDFQFVVEDIARIEWAADSNGNDYAFTTTNPSLLVHWTELSIPLATYRFKVGPEASDLRTAAGYTTKQNKIDVALPNEGPYAAQVEALNANSQIIGQSDVKVFNVKRQPLLPGPRWTTGTPEVLKSDSKGNLNLDWEQVQGAASYLMVLESLDGQVIDRREISRTTASVARLKPGSYQVHLQSVDAFKRPGPAADSRRIEVPAIKPMQAPKIKTITVK